MSFSSLAAPPLEGARPARALDRRPPDPQPDLKGALLRAADELGSVTPGELALDDQLAESWYLRLSLLLDGASQAPDAALEEPLARLHSAISRAGL